MHPITASNERAPDSLPLMLIPSALRENVVPTQKVSINVDYCPWLPRVGRSHRDELGLQYSTIAWLFPSAPARNSFGMLRVNCKRSSSEQRRPDAQ